MLAWMIGTVIGVFSVGWMPLLPPLSITALAAAAASLWVWWRATSRGFFVLGLALGAAYGVGWGYSLLAQRLPSALESVAMEVEGQVLEPPQLRTFSGGGQRQRFRFKPLHVSCSGGHKSCTGQLGTLLLSYYGSQPLRAGQYWRLQVKLKRPWGLANTGSFNYQTWLSQQRLSATGYVRDQDMHQLNGSFSYTLIHQLWRQDIDEVLRSGVAPGLQQGVILALSNGDRSAILPEDWRRFQRYGLNHLVVISGLHVGMVALVGYFLGGMFGRRSAHITAFMLACVYAALAGFTLPTVRALVMLGCVQASSLHGRTVSPLRSLLLAVLACALVDPLAPHGAGFWLSFGAVASIFYVRFHFPDLKGWRALLWMQCCLSVLVGLLGSYWFGGLGWMAPIANVIAIPILTFWMAPLCLLGSMLAPICPEAAELSWQIATLPLQGFEFVDGLIADTSPDAAAVLWWSWQPGLVVLLFSLCTLLCWLAHPAFGLRWLGVLTLLLGLFARPERPLPGELHLWVLDVGQGLAVVVRTRDTTLIYDTGAGDPQGPNMATSVILPWLRRQQIQTIDLLVISHGDRDHASGVYSLHDALHVSETWVGDAPFEGIRRQYPCRAGKRWQQGELQLTVLSPSAKLPDSKRNNLSCVVMLEFADERILLPGDIEAQIELDLVRRLGDELAATVLVVPHHGSRTSSTGPFLRRVSPQLAIFSRGYANRFSHPHAEVLQRYHRMGIQTVDTAQQGALELVWREGEAAQLRSWREQHKYYWHGS